MPPKLNRLLIRVSRGRVGVRKRGIPIGLLTTTGRRSGEPRTVPVMYLRDDDRFFVVASNGGFDSPPDWLRNLDETPDARFEVDGEQRLVRGRILAGDEKDEWWPALVAHNPLWAAYQRYTDRDIAVVSLEPR